MLLYVLELTIAIPSSLVFLRFVSLQLSWSSGQVQGLQPAFLGTVTFLYKYLMNNIGYLLTLSYHLKSSLAPKYLVHVILRPHSASFNRPLRSFRRLLDDSTFVLGDTVVRPADTIRNLGVQFDSCMTMT